MAPRPQSPAIAALFMIAATVFIAATMLLAKLLGKDTLGPPMHPLQISQGRFFFALLVLGLAVATLRPRFSRPDWRLHAGRTISGWAGVTLMFAAVVYIPLSDATAITFLNPVFCMLLAIPFWESASAAGAGWRRRSHFAGRWYSCAPAPRVLRPRPCWRLSRPW